MCSRRISWAQLLRSNTAHHLSLKPLDGCDVDTPVQCNAQDMAQPARGPGDGGGGAAGAAAGVLRQPPPRRPYLGARAAAVRPGACSCWMLLLGPPPAVQTQQQPQSSQMLTGQPGFVCMCRCGSQCHATWSHCLSHGTFSPSCAAAVEALSERCRRVSCRSCGAAAARQCACGPADTAEC